MVLLNPVCCQVNVSFDRIIYMIYLGSDPSNMLVTPEVYVLASWCRNYGASHLFTL